MKKQIVICSFILFAFIHMVTAQTMTVKDSDSNVLMEVNDEGAVGSITLPAGSAPGTTTDKLYNVGGSLYWNGSQLGTAGSAGGWTDGGPNVYLTTSTDKVGIGDDSPTYTLDVAGKIGINDTQILYLPDQTIFTGTLIIGNGGGSLNPSGGEFNTAVGIDAFRDNTTGTYNTASGYHALLSNTTGHNNMASGTWSLKSNTTGHNNTASGSGALIFNTTGYENTASGYGALRSNTTGNSNTAVGYQADYYNQNGSNNTVVGFEAGRRTSEHNKSGNVFLGYQAGYNETGSNKLYIENSNSSTPLIGGDFTENEVYLNGNVGIGDTSPTHTLDVAGKIGINDTQVLYLPDQTNFTGTLFLGTGGGSLSHSSVNEGRFNTAIGIGALNDNTTGRFNTASGYRALSSNTTGTHNTASGYFALSTNMTGSNNTASGNGALQVNDTGGNNTASGHGALYLNDTGNNNTGIGLWANFYNENGSNNTIIGSGAGYGTTFHDKTGNVFIGYQAGYNEIGDNNLYIENSSSGSPLIWGDFSNDRVVIDGNSSDNTNNRTFFVNGSAGGTSPWNNDSDERLKKNIETIPDALDKVQKLRGVNFQWKETENHEDGVRFGFVAQEAENIIPEVVNKNGEYYCMQYAPITALLVEAVKEQQKKISLLEQKIKELENK